MGTHWRETAGDPSASTDRDNITLWKTDAQRKTMRVQVSSAEVHFPIRYTRLVADGDNRGEGHMR